MIRMSRSRRSRGRFGGEPDRDGLGSAVARNGRFDDQGARLGPPARDSRHPRRRFEGSDRSLVGRGLERASRRWTRLADRPEHVGGFRYGKLSAICFEDETMAEDFRLATLGFAGISSVVCSVWGPGPVASSLQEAAQEQVAKMAHGITEKTRPALREFQLPPRAHTGGEHPHLDRSGPWESRLCRKQRCHLANCSAP
jgi:hypothetical protein